MKKKIITLALAVVMCLSVITSVTAADTLNRVASTIPGTDIEYNYVENVTVQIPGTDVTFELEKVAEKVGISSYGDMYPIYIFDFYEEESKELLIKKELQVLVAGGGYLKKIIWLWANMLQKIMIILMFLEVLLHKILTIQMKPMAQKF